MQDREHIAARLLGQAPIALAVAWVGLSLAWLSRSLNLDEPTTSWVVENGLSDVYHRALHYHGQSPLYHVIE